MYGPARNVFIACLLLLTVSDVFRNSTELHRRFTSFTDPVLDMLGIRQGRWSLFAPNVGNFNYKIIAHVTYADKTVVDVPQIDWHRQSLWDSFVRFPEEEYWTWVRQNRAKVAWPALARYTLAHVPATSPTNAKPVQVKLERRWAQMRKPPPKVESKQTPPGPLLHLSQTYNFYTYKVKP
jgi:hypothetical protein